MENLKLDELIVRSAWAIGNVSPPITENEKNIVRAMRAFFKMDVDRFNNSYNTFKTLNGHLPQLKDKDPITKIISRWAACEVAFKENEGLKESNLSDEETDFISQITDAINIPSFIELDIRLDVFQLAFNFIYEISSPQLLIDKDLLNIIELEKGDGVIYTRRIQPLLKAFFNSLEKNNLFITWEENYLALIRYKSELQDMFGKMDLKEFDTRYKELKPLISNQKKEKIAKEKQLAKELADKEKQIAKEKAEKEKQLAKDLAAKEKQLAKEKEELEKNKTHEYSVSNGIHYCKYCGGGETWREHDCQRELGHKYTLRRVQNKVGFDYSNQPVCNNCGDIRHYCSPDWEYKFKCEID